MKILTLWLQCQNNMSVFDEDNDKEFWVSKDDIDIPEDVNINDPEVEVTID